MDDNYLKANNGLERKVIISVLPRMVEIESPIFITEQKAIEFDRLLVWADRGLLDSFKAIPGVMWVSQDKDAGVRYILSIDPRYNLKWVIAEVEAAAQLYEPQKSEPPDTIEYGWQPSFLTTDTTNT